MGGSSIKTQWGVLEAKGRWASQKRGQEWKIGTQRSIYALSLFSASFPMFASFFLFNKRAFLLLLRPAGSLPTISRAQLPESHLQVQPAVQFHIPHPPRGVSGALGSFICGHGVESHSPTWLWSRGHCELGRYPPKGIHPFCVGSLLLFSFFTLASLAQLMPSTGLTLSAAAFRSDWLWGSAQHILLFQEGNLLYMVCGVREASLQAEGL